MKKYSFQEQLEMEKQDEEFYTKELYVGNLSEASQLKILWEAFQREIKTVKVSKNAHKERTTIELSDGEELILFEILEEK